jgi:hypothetical protein
LLPNIHQQTFLLWPLTNWNYLLCFWLNEPWELMGGHMCDNQFFSCAIISAIICCKRVVLC